MLTIMPRLSRSSLLRFHSDFHRAAQRKTGLNVHVGIPIGALTSRLIANLALDSLDRQIESRSDVICYRRYVDDFVLVAHSRRDDRSDFSEILSRFLPLSSATADEKLSLDVSSLNRAGSEFSCNAARYVFITLAAMRVRTLSRPSLQTLAES
jgi:hypothetical protein